MSSRAELKQRGANTLAIEEQVLIRRKPEDVFRFVAEGWFENLGKWNPNLVENAKLTEGPVGPGTRGREAQTIQGTRRERIYEVVGFERPRMMVVCNVGETDVEKHYRSSYQFVAVGDGTVLHQRFELQWDLPLFRVAPWLVRIFIRRDIRASQQRIKALVEALPSS